MTLSEQPPARRPSFPRPGPTGRRRPVPAVPAVPPGAWAGTTGPGCPVRGWLAGRVDALPAFPDPEAAGPARRAGRLDAADEQVVRGLLAALGTVLLCGVLLLAVRPLGAVASLTSLLLAAGAIYAYARAAGAPPQRGVVPLLGIVLLGVLTALAASVGFAPGGLQSSRADLALSLAFAAVGALGTLRLLFPAHR